MNKRTRLNLRTSLLALAIGLAASAAMAFGDCNRSVHASGGALPSAAINAADTATAQADPSLDGLVARYADLHRDAMGYAMGVVTDTAVYARAVTDQEEPEPR